LGVRRRLAGRQLQHFSYDLNEINAFDPTTGMLEGTIQTDDGGIPSGLWALDFGTGGQNGNPTTLYVTDGSNSENDRLFGTIAVLEPEPACAGKPESCQSAERWLDPPPSIVMIEPVV
jgi:hypothetical protein